MSAHRVTVVGGPGLPNLPGRGVLFDGRALAHHPNHHGTEEFGWGHRGSGPRTLAAALAAAAGAPEDGEYEDRLLDIVSSWDKDANDFEHDIPAP